MDDLTRDMQSVRAHVDAVWDEHRSARTFDRLKRRRRQRRVVMAAAATVTTAAAALVLMLPQLQPEPIPPESAAAAVQKVDRVVHESASTPSMAAEAPQPAPLLALAGGSRVTSLAADTEVTAVSSREDEIKLRLDRGHARFDVVPRTHRVFAVHAGDFTVSAIGTVFEVERDAERVHVAVAQGRVRVDGPGADGTELSPGEGSWFSADPAPEAEPELRPGRVAPGWRELAEAGNYGAAYERLRAAGSSPTTPADLMLAADTARLTGHQTEAARYLARVVDRHGRSPLAPLAAFTLGRIQLDGLGQPTRAATSFGRCQDLAPRGPMAEDALAREVEALSKAGKSAEARARASDYLERYPDGRRERAVRLHGGLR